MTHGSVSVARCQPPTTLSPSGSGRSPSCSGGSPTRVRSPPTPLPACTHPGCQKSPSRSSPTTSSANSRATPATAAAAHPTPWPPPPSRARLERLAVARRVAKGPVSYSALRQTLELERRCQRQQASIGRMYPHCSTVPRHQGPPLDVRRRSRGEPRGPGPCRAPARLQRLGGQGREVGPPCALGPSSSLGLRQHPLRQSDREGVDLVNETVVESSARIGRQPRPSRRLCSGTTPTSVSISKRAPSPARPGR